MLSVALGKVEVSPKKNDTHISRIPTVVIVCTILNNICGVNENEFSHEWVEDAGRAADEEDRVGQHAEMPLHCTLMNNSQFQ